MTDNTDLRQRRGKKSIDPAATKKSSSSSPAPEEKSSGKTPIESLHSAQAKLIVSRDRTADLHAAWKAQLMRLSLLIVFISIYQLQTSISTCIREIKDSNEPSTEGIRQDSGAIVAGVGAVKLIFGDSFCELLGVFVSVMLAYFLALSNTSAVELEHWSYMISSALVPVSLGFFFHSKQLGCIGGNGIDNIDEYAKDRHQFPVVVIYHTIVTVAFWFMKSGMQQCEDHVQLVNNSIEDFARMDKKIAQKKTLRAKKK